MQKSFLCKTLKRICRVALGSLGWPRAAVLLEAASPSSLMPCDSVGAQVWSLARDPPKAACGVSLDSINASACPLLQDNAARAA